MLTVFPMYLETAFETIFAPFHAPAGGQPFGAAVLICGPWGWDDVASYRSRRRWAERLAAAGHPVLRFDLPATGNSAGVPTDPDLLEAWIGAVGTGAEWLRANSSAPRVVGLGLGLGGLLAREAIARGAPLEELVLWGAPTTGRTFSRETNAFSRMQTWSGQPLGRASLPEGAIEAGGFVLSAQTLEALKGLDPEPAPAGLRRTLLLDRDGIAVDARLREGMEAAGVEVETASGAGWGNLVGHPERSRLDPAVADTVDAWLAVAETASSAGPDAGEARTLKMALEVGDVKLEESVREIPQSFGNAFGVYTRRSDAQDGNLCAVFLNAGAVRDTGPNRMWVETARRGASAGVPSLRVDLAGIGDADGDEARFSDVAEFYIPEYEDQVIAVLDSLEADGIASRFVLVGLCAGAYWAFRVARRDRRIESLALLNAGALTWNESLLRQRDARKLDRVFQRRWWGKLSRGEVKNLTPTAALRMASARFGRRSSRGGMATRHAIESDLDRIRDLGPRLVLAFSGEEPMHTELAAEGVLEHLERWPNLELCELPGADHTLRPLAAQTATAELLDRELQNVTAAIAPR
jgi:pimeloyl-ACP methyl ester carboxylesterase